MSFYPYNLGPVSQGPIITEPENSNEETMFITEVLTIDSADRDANLYPNPNSYVIDLLKKTGRTFKNVKEIRLLTGTLPDQSNITQEPYLILSVDEFNSNMAGTNNYIQSGSCILQLDRPISTGYFLNLKTDLCKCIVHNFQNPKEISRLTIKIYDKAGNLFNFGSDSNPPAKNLQHILSFEFTMEVKKPVIRSKIPGSFVYT